MLQAEVSSSIPAGLLDLMWEEFFVSRKRGLAPALNLPWIAGPDVFFVYLRDGSRMLGGLVVRKVECRRSRRVAGVVGLVCVHPDARGRGYAGSLLEVAIAKARELRFDDLLLWTQKPGVYMKFGFASVDSAIFGSVTAGAPARSVTLEKGLVRKAAWPAPPERRGLPAFAVGASRWSLSGTSLIVIDEANGPILAEWGGGDATVLSLIEAVMPDHWRLNALATDSLPSALVAHGWRLQMAQSALQMILPLRQYEGSCDPYQLRLLDRI